MDPVVMALMYDVQPPGNMARMYQLWVHKVPKDTQVHELSAKIEKDIEGIMPGAHFLRIAFKRYSVGDSVPEVVHRIFKGFHGTVPENHKPNDDKGLVRFLGTDRCYGREMMNKEGFYIE